VNINPLLRIAAAAPALVLAITLCACGSYSAGNGAGCGIYGGMCPPTNAPPPAMTDCSALAPASGIIQINLALSTCNDTTNGSVRGFTTAGASSNVIKAPAGSNIQFVNNDAVYMHTADFLGSALPFPALYSTARAASAAGTLINDPNFSTGVLALNGGMSAVYKVPPAGTVTLLGCSVTYNTFLTRTVVIAQ
jgi:hypothetical protein